MMADMFCCKCDLSEKRTQVVWGVGRKSTDIMFIGEAPGAVEDMTGIPFVGRSGKLLREVMDDVGMDPQDVYITNIVKCKPPDNRTPTAREIRICKRYLLDEIEYIDPRLIVFVGATSARGVTKVKINMEKDSGMIFQWNGRDCMVIYHPGWIIRALSVRKPILERQLKKIADVTKFKRPRGLEKWQ